MIFLDTCILIDYSRNIIDIKEERKSEYCFSSIVELEFIVGAQNRRELKKINSLVAGFNIVDTDQEIMDLATILTNKYALSHNMTVYDAIIAATCLVYDLPLWTLNTKDFKYIDNLELTKATPEKSSPSPSMQREKVRHWQP